MRYLSLAFLALVAGIGLAQKAEPPKHLDPINVAIPSIATDKSIAYDYDIVYVRAKRAGDKVHKRFYTDFSSPVVFEAGADLMLLHPDGKEELLVAGGKGSITDPVVSFDAQWVYYVHVHDLTNASQWSPPRAGADIYKIHLKSRKIVRLTNQKFSPNTGAAPWSSNYRKAEPGKSHLETGVYNMGPYPLPGGRIVFTSNRDGFRPAKGYPAIALQLFVMDDRDTDLPEEADPGNLDKIGHLNLAGALHPVALRDGRIMYSTLESQGARGDILWGIWTIHPDGTNWAPLVSAFDPGGAPNGFHFQTQISDGHLVIEEYYNQNNSGFGAYIKMPPTPPDDYPAFGPGYMNDPRNKAWRFGRHDNGNPRFYKMPFMPTGSVSLTPFSHGLEGQADTSIRGDKTSPRVGKFTHPSGAPNNHLLTIYSPGPVNHQYTYLPQLDGGIYLLKNGEVVNEPAQLRLIKNDPEYNESWPRAVVPYERVHGLKEPKSLPRLANDGKLSPHLPAGTPFGLVGASSFYKRESYPNGVVPKGSVTATHPGGNDPWKGLDAFTSHGNGMPLNWHNQGADAGLYTNEDIHSVRILAMEPTTDRKGAVSGRRYHNHAGERLRILGEIPLRKPGAALDPDGNPDTSFLAKIPADVGFTFQTLDKRGQVLNAAQTWHQLRPGEVRVNCGGCHAHSQEPTAFEKTLAAKPNFAIADLTTKATADVEYHRDIKPILQRSCVACHSGKAGNQPAAKLDLDADDEAVQIENHGKFPGTYARLAMDERAKFGIKPIGYDSWGYPNASRYVRKFQSRRSLLVWKVHGERLDGFHNDDHPSEAVAGDGVLQLKGQPVDLAKNKARYDLDFLGTAMPPPEAVKSGKVTALTDDDRRKLAAWIDLGCPIDLDAKYGWFLDEQRPTLALTLPKGDLSHLLVGMTDHGSGLDAASFRVTADVEIDGVKAGTNLAERFRTTTTGVWEWKPKTAPKAAVLTVEIQDRQGNTSRLERAIR